MRELIIIIISTLILVITFKHDISVEEYSTEEKQNIHYKLNSDGPDSSHQKFAEQSLKILENDKGKEEAMFFSEYKTLLLDCCDRPDDDENNYAYAYHFYNPYTKLNFVPSIFKISRVTGMTQFQSHIKNAVNLYKIDKEESMKELGRAIHYLEDINVPHHSANLIAFFSSHIQYENYIDKNKSEFFIDTSSAYDKFNECKFEKYCENLFEECAVHSYFYRNMIRLCKRLSWDKAAYPTLKLAQENIASLLYRFKKEVENN